MPDDGYPKLIDPAVVPQGPLTPSGAQMRRGVPFLLNRTEGDPVSDELPADDAPPPEWVTRQRADAGLPPLPVSQDIEISTEGLDDPIPLEAPQIFSTPAGDGSSLRAEELAFSALETASLVVGDAKGLALQTAQVFATIALGRATREHTASLREPPVAYSLNRETGKIERTDSV